MVGLKWLSRIRRSRTWLSSVEHLEQNIGKKSISTVHSRGGIHVSLTLKLQ